MNAACFHHDDTFQMVRFQVVDSERLLIRWAASDSVRPRLLSEPPSVAASLFSVYNVATTTMEGAWPGDSQELADILDADVPHFFPPSKGSKGDGRWTRSGTPRAAAPPPPLPTRGPSASPTGLPRPPSAAAPPPPAAATSPSSPPSPRATPSRPTSTPPSSATTTSSSRPRSAPSGLSSFLFPGIMVSIVVMLRCGDVPVGFFSRGSGQLAFQLHCGVGSQCGSGPEPRALVAFILHPSDPLIISVQRKVHRPTDTRYITNFHLRASLDN